MTSLHLPSFNGNHVRADSRLEAGMNGFGGGAPEGGWAPERGDPPEGGVAALATTSAGGDFDVRADSRLEAGMNGLGLCIARDESKSHCWCAWHSHQY